MYVSGYAALLAVSACTVTSSLSGLPGRPANTAPALLLLLLKRPHYNCVASEWAVTSYLSSGMGSFMSAGHRFNTRPVMGMTGGLAGWWMAWLTVEAVLLSDWMLFWWCWGHQWQMEQNVLLGNITRVYELIWLISYVWVCVCVCVCVCACVCEAK